MSAYRQLAEALGGDVFLVAPDRIGDQEHTLALLREWAPRLRELREMGANVLVPIQKGTRPQADFHVDVAAVLGFDGWIPAIPSKKNATTVEELAAYVQAIRPPRLHLLGLGSRNRNAARMLEAAAGCEVSVDACLIAAMVGRTNGPGGGPRRLTIARDAAAYLIRTGAAPARYTTQELGVILAFGEPHHIEKALRR